MPGRYAKREDTVCCNGVGILLSFNHTNLSDGLMNARDVLTMAKTQNINGEIIVESSNGGYSALVVDDSPYMRFFLTRMLQRHGFLRVNSAVHGKEGVEKYLALRPDFVFLDAIMPEMDGLETLRELKRRNPRAIVVMITSLSEKEKVLEFKQAGAACYLLKPFEDDKFSEILSKLVELREEQLRKG